MASYVLFVSGRYDLSHRPFPILKDAALALKESSGRPFNFVIQCFGKDGRFYTAFGGCLRENGVEYDGWTTNNKTVKNEMTRFRKYFTSV